MDRGRGHQRYSREGWIASAVLPARSVCNAHSARGRRLDLRYDGRPIRGPATAHVSPSDRGVRIGPRPSLSLGQLTKHVSVEHPKNISMLCTESFLPSPASQLSQPSIAPELPKHGDADNSDEPKN